MVSGFNSRPQGLGEDTADLEGPHSDVKAESRQKETTPGAHDFIRVPRLGPHWSIQTRKAGFR